MVAVDPDEDFVSSAAGPSDQADVVSRTVPDGEFLAEARSPAGPDFGDEDEPAAHGRKEDLATDLPRQDEPACIPLQRPFENLPPLPEDLAGAFESFQLAILRHKASGWQETSCDDVLASLDALKTLTLAPSAADA